MLDMRGSESEADGKTGTDLAGAEIAEPPFAHDERWLTVERIANGAFFNRSARLRELLLYIAGRSLARADEQLTEYEIGRHLFGRGAQYVPADDSVVRSSVRQLRLKLREYFDAHSDEKWVIEIPKGRYLATFEPRNKPDESPNIETAAINPLIETMPKPRVKWDWPMFTLGAVCAVSLAINVWFWIQHIQTAAAAISEDQLGFAPALISRSARPTQFVLDDYAFVLLSRLTHQTSTSVEEYANRSYMAKNLMPSRDPALADLWKLLQTRMIVSLGAEATAERLLRGTPQNSKLIVRHARNMAVREFQDGNFILFGSHPNNEWTDLFTERLNFRTTSLPSEQACFENLKPQAGERRLYCTDGPASINSGVAYARVAFLPNLSGNGFVLLIAGLNMVTSEAAGEFLVDASQSKQLLKLFGAGSFSGLPYFEVLLRTSAVDTTPSKIRIVAYRRIG